MNTVTELINAREVRLARVLRWKIYRLGSVIADVIQLEFKMKIHLNAVILIVGFSVLAGCTKSSGPVSDGQERTEPKSTWLARGRVLLPDRQPTVDYHVAKFWSANGANWDDSGNPPQNMTELELSEFWSNEGVMEPLPLKRGGGRVAEDGTFEIENSTSHPCVALVLNTERTHGGIASTTPDANDPMTITLEPLVRVFGKIRCGGQIPPWTNAYVFYPGSTKEAPD